MSTFKGVESQITVPGMLIARMAQDAWTQTDFRPKENEAINTLMEHNQQSHIVNSILMKNVNHAAYYFNKEDSQLVINKVDSNRKLKLKDLLLNCLGHALKELNLSKEIVHLDIQKNTISDNPENCDVIAYDLGKMHRKKLQSDIQLMMIPPLFEEKISVSFCIFANQLSLAVNGNENIKNLLLEMWINEINKELFS